MSIIAWIILGGLTGWIATKIMGTDSQYGVIANIIIGIIGAFVGALIVNIFGGDGITGFNLWTAIVAVLGSILVLWLKDRLAHNM